MDRGLAKRFEDQILSRDNCSARLDAARGVV